MKVKIRKFKKSDLKNINKLVMELDRYESEWWPYAVVSQNKSLRWLKSRLKKNRAEIFLALDGKKLIGFALGWVEKSDYHTRIKKWGYLSHIYVSPKYRRKGIGMLLVKKMIGWFKKNKMKYITLWVFWQNDLGKKVWRSLGFKESEILMQKRIN